jgi:hypothetical protein
MLMMMKMKYLVNILNGKYELKPSWYINDIVALLIMLKNMMKNNDEKYIEYI